MLRVEIDSVATVLLRVPAPIAVVPSRKVTEPVGVPVPGGFAVTTALKITEAPKVEGFDEEAKLVVVEALTVCERVGEELVRLFESPL